MSGWSSRCTDRKAQESYSSLADPGGENSRPHKTLYTVFTVALFIITKNRKQPKYPSLTDGVCPHNGTLVVVV